MQWLPEPNGGFCPAIVHPWLPVNPDVALGINVADQEKDPNSLLNFYRQVIRVRRHSPSLKYGDYEPVENINPAILAFHRKSEDKAIAVYINMNDKVEEVSNLKIERQDVIFNIIRKS